MRKILARLHRFEELSLTLIYLSLAMVAFVQVFCRYALGVSFTWFEEAGRYVGILVAFMGASIGVRLGAHFSMDLVTASLPPRPAAVVRAVVNVLGGACMLVIAYFGMRLVVRNYGYETTSPAMQLPMYLAYLPIPVFSALMAVRMFLVAAVGVPGGEGEGRAP